MLSTNSQHIDASESESSPSSTAWSDPDVSESQAACATLRDTSSSLLSIGPDITRQAMASRTTTCRALLRLFHSINCEPSRETGGCTHACPSRPSCDHTHTRAARQCRPTITTRSSMRITRPCVPAFGFFFWFSSWCACVRFFFAFRKQVIMQDAKTYDADATEPMPTRCARSRIEARCCHRDHGRSG